MKRFFGQKGALRHSRKVLDELWEIEPGEMVPEDRDFPVVIFSAKGARVRDLNGNFYVDLSSFFGVSSVGFCNPNCLRTLGKQAHRLMNGMGDMHKSHVVLRFVKTLKKHLRDKDYKVFFGLSGSDAVETALKFACAATGRALFVAFEGAYHGLTLGALQVCGQERFRKQFVPLLNEDVQFLPFPAKGLGLKESVLDKVREILGREPRPSAVIIEAIQGRGGIRVCEDGFLRALFEECKKNGVILICDEIWTGVGRTGRFLASDYEDVAPDIVCLGKGLGGGVPLSCCLMREWIADAVKSCDGEAVHTSTFYGYPLGCATAMAVLEEIEEGGLLQRAEEIEKRVFEVLVPFVSRIPFVVEVRGKGAMIGIEIKDFGGKKGGQIAYSIMKDLLKEGVIVTTEGENGNVLAINPPLTIDFRDLDFGLEKMQTVMERFRE
jgi:4-aminobutyrate aminotransferase/(S)-3-amino-2-methylpropionate transaminase